VQIVLGRVLKAQVVLRGLVIEWVKVKGFSEEFTAEDGKVHYMFDWLNRYIYKKK
jgi:hypothetical protein